MRYTEGTNVRLYAILPFLWLRPQNCTNKLVQKLGKNELLLQCGYKWVRYSGARYVVPGMISIGRDLDGANLVVGRAHHHGDVIPAKAKPEHGVAYIAYGGVEHMKHDFEILMPAEFNWIPSRHGQVPHGAVDAGRTADGEVLYVGRVIHNGVPCIGKVHPSHGSLYIPYNGEEVPFREYEVLVQY